MFTGIVEEKGVVLGFEEGPEAWTLTVSARRILKGLEIGESVAVNGCCLSVVRIDESTVSFEVIEETLRLTSLRNLMGARKSGRVSGSDTEVLNFPTISGEASVNLERSLSSDGRFGGHFVNGHIDATGEITHFEPRGKDHTIRVAPPLDQLKYVVYKGSIAIDGISLTVAEVDESGFAVCLIPLTIKSTNISERSVGDDVNLEFDLLGKYVERFLSS